MSDWLIFATQAAAESAVKQIDAQVGNPRKGRNGGTGNPEQGKVGTLTWAIAVQRTDGKWCFQRNPQADPNRPFDVEQWNPAWFPQGEGA